MIEVFDVKTVEICKLTDYDTLIKVKDLWSDMMFELGETHAKPIWWLVEAERMLGDPRVYKIYLANTIETGVVGFFDCIYLMNPIEGRLEVRALYTYIKPEFRHSGVFRKLFNAASNEAKENKISVMTASTGPLMEKFWSDFGFTMKTKEMEMSL